MHPILSIVHEKAFTTYLLAKHSIISLPSTSWSVKWSLLFRVCYTLYASQTPQHILVTITTLREEYKFQCSCLRIFLSIYLFYLVILFLSNLFSYTPNALVEWLTPLLRIREVLGSNLGPEAGYTNLSFSWLSSVPPCECLGSTLNWSTTASL
jgi:hypothetical protein